MLISEVCKLTGLTKKAINYYVQKGIINPSIDESGYRDFSDQDIKLLKDVYIYRSLGLSVNDIKSILGSRIPKEKFRIFTLKKKLENDVSNTQAKLLEQLVDGKRSEEIKEEIEELNKKKSIKEKLLEMFPGFYGRFLMMHFSRFLNEPIKTKKQRDAYEKIIEFLDEVNPLNISDEILNDFEEAMNFWTNEKLEEADKQKQYSIENPEEFLEENSQIIEQYNQFKKTEAYKNSSAFKLMEAMKEFGRTSGYNDIFIPEMRRLSPSYEEYYQNLIKANEVILGKYPEI